MTSAVMVFYRLAGPVDPGSDRGSSVLVAGGVFTAASVIGPLRSVRYWRRRIDESSVDLTSVGAAGPPVQASRSM